MAGVLGLVVPSAASAQVGLDATPVLYPAFDPAVHDYVTRCANGPVQVGVTGDPGRLVGVDGDAPRGGSFSRSVALADSQSFAVKVADTGGTLLDTYRVRCLPSEFPGFSSARTGSPQASWYIVTPGQSFGPAPPGISPFYSAIFDNEGVPTWWFRSSPYPPVDAKLLANGNVAFNYFNTGTSGGSEERTLGGVLVRTLNTVGVGSDLHDLLLLPNGNYLLMAYHERPGFDLSPIGGANPATAIDAEIQEIDPDNPSVPVWTWNASDHIDASQVAPRWRAVSQQPGMFGSNDIYHINSFERDGDGYILSFRALDAVYRINRSDGSIDWKLGGTDLPGKSLTVIDDPKVDPDGPLAGQHDARVLPNGDITIHDNGGYFNSAGQYVGQPPRAVRYRIDASAKTATWVEQVTDSLAPLSICCGSSRKLAGGNWVMAWGGSTLVTELTRDGARVFSLKFDAPPMFSYRADPVTSDQLTSQALQTGMNAQHPRSALTLSGASGAFGQTLVGSPSPAQPFTVTNTGQGPVQIAATEIAGADANQYSASGCAPRTLAAGASCQAAVRFTPTSTGDHGAATLRVSSDASSGPNDAQLRGSGIVAPPPPPAAAPAQASTPTQARPFAAKLEILRARVLRSARRLSVLASITSRAAGTVKVAFRASGRTERFTAAIDAGKRRISINRPIPAAMARKGTGILTITYAGDRDTQPQEVRLRAASQQAKLDASRPRISNGRLLASGKLSTRARGVVRLQLLYDPPDGQTQTLKYTARIADGRYSFDESLASGVLAAIRDRRGTVHSYTLFTGYLPRRIRGELASYQILGPR